MASSKRSATFKTKDITRKLQAANSKREQLANEHKKARREASKMFEVQYMPTYSNHLPKKIPAELLNPTTKDWRAITNYEQERNDGWEEGEWDKESRRKTWYACRADNGLKYRMTAAEVKKLTAELKAPGGFEEANRKKIEIGRELFAIRREIKRLEALKARAEMKK